MAGLKKQKNVQTQNFNIIQPKYACCQLLFWLIVQCFLNLGVVGSWRFHRLLEFFSTFFSSFQPIPPIQMIQIQTPHRLVWTHSTFCSDFSNPASSNVCYSPYLTWKIKFRTHEPHLSICICWHTPQCDFVDICNTHLITTQTYLIRWMFRSLIWPLFYDLNLYHILSNSSNTMTLYYAYITICLTLLYQSNSVSDFLRNTVWIFLIPILYVDWQITALIYF